MPRRSRFAEAAEDWLRNNAHGKAISTKQFWEGLSELRPDLTTPSDMRKTPKATCMRDLRGDSAFELSDGKIALKR